MSPLHLLRPCWTAFLNSLRGSLSKPMTSERSGFRSGKVFVNKLLGAKDSDDCV